MSFGTVEQKQGLVRRALGCFVTSIFLLAAVMLMRSTFGPVFFVRGDATFAYGFQVLHLVLWVLGCGWYAKSKGCSGILGITGTLCVFGAMILLVLPDRWTKSLKERPPTAPTGLSNYPR